MGEPKGRALPSKGLLMDRLHLFALTILILALLSPLLIVGASTIDQGSISPVYFEGKPVALTPEEQAYLSRTGTVTMCVDPDWEPYELVTPDGEFLGIAADLIGLVANRGGVSLELVPTSDWDESITASQEGRCQIIAFLTQTPARDEWLIFTDPYFSDPNVIITRNEHDYISDPARLVNETIALPNGTSVEERIRRDYPNLIVVNSGHSEADAFRMVEEGQADMTVRSLTMAAYTIRKEGFFNLKIAGQIPGYTNDFRIGVLKNETVLRDILNKGVQTITPQEVQEVINRHISIEVRSGIDWGLILRIVLVLSLLILVSLIYAYHLRRLNALLEKREEELSAQLDVIKQAEKEIRYSEEKFRLIAENSTDFIWVMNLDETFSYVSPSVLDLTGYTADEAIHQKLEDMVTPESLGGFKEAIERAILAYQTGSILPFRIEYEMPCKDGSTVWVEDRAVLITDENGTATGFVGVTRDISEGRRAALAIKENEEKFIAIFEEAPDPILIISQDLRIIDANQGFLKRFGYTEDEALSKTLTGSFLAPIADLIRSKRDETGSSAAYREEMVLHTRAGLPFIAEVALSILLIRTDPRYLVQIHDIDEIRRAHDAVEQANRKLNILSSITRHDILNRIMVTSVYSEELKQQLSNPVHLKQIQAISQANDEIYALIAFTGQYQDLGVQAPAWQYIDRILMKRAITSLLQEVRLTTDLGDLEVYADQMMEKVLFNLVENSIRHGQDISQISLSRYEEKGDCIILYEDDGGGISEEDKKQIFKKGFGKNTGLGLFLIREILSITGITIIEDGEPGKGVRFVIRVPKGRWREQRGDG